MNKLIQKVVIVSDSHSHHELLDLIKDWEAKIDTCEILYIHAGDSCARYDDQLDGWLSVASFILFVVFAIIGLGGALFFYGIYLLVKGLIVYGIAQLLSGIAMLVVGILYLTVPDFQTAFYICLGIVIAVYGALLIVSAFIDVKKK